MNQKSETGAVLAESALMLPLLVFLTIAAVDLANLMKVYSQVNRAVYEGARYGAATLELQQNVQTQNNSPSTDSPLQDDVNRRVGEIMEELKLTEGMVRSYQLCQRPNGQSIDRVVRVTVEYDFRPLFTSFFGVTIPIRVTDYGPWLFRSSNPLRDCEP